MIYLSGKRTPSLPAMLTPRMGQRPLPGQTWAADNGRFSAPQDYSDAGYLEWLASMPVDSCLFATAPDVVADALATYALSLPMFPKIRALGYPAALVAQDGLEDLTIPWDAFDALFIGGSTEWKLGPEAAAIAAEAPAYRPPVTSSPMPISAAAAHLLRRPGERRGVFVAMDDSAPLLT